MVIAPPDVKLATLASDVSPSCLIFFIFIYELLCLLNFYKLATRIKLYLKNIDERVAILLSGKGCEDSWVPVCRKRGAFFDGNSLSNETEMTIKEKPGAAVSKLSGVVQICGLFNRI